MDIQPPNSLSDNCVKHNQPILIYNSDPKIGACCLVCLQQQPGNISVEQFNKQQNEIYQQANKNIDQNHQIYQQLLDNFVNYKQRIIISLDKIIQIIIDQIRITQKSKTKLNNIIIQNSNQQQRINQLQETIKNQVKNDKQIKDQVKKLLNELPQKFSNIDDQTKILISGVQQNEISKKIQIPEAKVEQREKSDNIQFELIKESNQREETGCWAFAFNKDNTILIAAIKNEIAIYEFRDGKIIKELQRLNNHTKYITCLHFMKKSNSFVSGSWDETIIIWVLDQHNKWIAQQTLKEHTSLVNSILLAKMENQMLSGSEDQTIKIWSNKKGSWTCSQSIQTKSVIENMSLNEMENKLVICGDDGQNPDIIDNYHKIFQILVKQNTGEWEIVQTNADYRLLDRLSFTIGDQFVFTTQNSDQLIVYDYNTDEQRFFQLTSVKINAQRDYQSYFPCQFIKSLGILTFKNGKYLNIIKVDQNKNYELIQVIEFEDRYRLFGAISDDGQYIVTWDENSKEIQFRKIKYGI